MSLKTVGCGVVAAVALPLAGALFVVVCVLSFIQSLPGAGLAAAAMEQFAGRAEPTPAFIGAGRPGSSGDAALRPYESDIQMASARYGVDARLVGAVILQESGGDPRATSAKGAAGLMQLMPATFASLGYDPTQIYEPGHNIEAGVRYLAQSLAAFGGDVYWAAAAYNAGIDQARQLKETYGYVPASFAGGETSRYVAAIVARLAED